MNLQVTYEFSLASLNCSQSLIQNESRFFHPLVQSAFHFLGMQASWKSYVMIQSGMQQGGGQRGQLPPQILADQLTLSQPGGHMIPTQYYVPPRIFRPCDGPEYLSPIKS